MLIEKKVQRVGAGLAVVNGNCALLIRRVDNGMWHIPGSAVEPGESVEDAARPELWKKPVWVLKPLHCWTC
ncbi:NUDIX domain-containing protein [Deinococcus oregonensis]|uniref:NUDIX domain-containing protein n=1 Tax=Deinococcus oregonensis TaxID=1805970 RepID=A0ABV6AZV9_9DEIO